MSAQKAAVVLAGSEASIAACLPRRAYCIVVGRPEPAGGFTAMADGALRSRWPNSTDGALSQMHGALNVLPVFQT
ncbi:hypothetical protein LMG27174_03357 [Paraburkholderia rhynchosiae]|uniref:Uncharacterized protein n=1 Tax=Paraburkholderia rhynchosiae TaxID=487049 RepID=A0A6J5B8S1_9BURK|nr:hypothetical protein LMG27174_03357 [Paraburkholderia rhynchosiae]